MAMELMFRAWKGMLDGGAFLKAGLVHNLRLHQFSSTDNLPFLVMGKVDVILHRLKSQMNECILILQVNHSQRMSSCNIHTVKDFFWQTTEGQRLQMHNTLQPFLSTMDINIIRNFYM